jgi:hypothetical protein
MGPLDWDSLACKKCLTNGTQPEGDSHSSQAIALHRGSVPRVLRPSPPQHSPGGSKTSSSQFSPFSLSSSVRLHCMPFTNLEADVLPASPLASSTVDWIQPSRHVVPKSRVAIATQPVHRGLLKKTGISHGEGVAIPGFCKCRRCMKWMRSPRIAAEESR